MKDYKKLVEIIQKANPEIGERASKIAYKSGLGASEWESFVEISLEDVLMVLEKKYNNKKLQLEGKNIYYNCTTEGKIGTIGDMLRNENQIWQLGKTLDQQKKETKEFLIDLLVKK